MEAGRWQSSVSADSRCAQWSGHKEDSGFRSRGIQPHKERGLLLLYVLDPQKAEAGFSAEAPGVVAFGISFPAKSNAGTKVEYKVNNVLWEQEYGPAE